MNSIYFCINLNIKLMLQFNCWIKVFIYLRKMFLLAPNFWNQPRRIRTVYSISQFSQFLLIPIIWGLSEVTQHYVKSGHKEFIQWHNIHLPANPYRLYRNGASGVIFADTFWINHLLFGPNCLRSIIHSCYSVKRRWHICGQNVEEMWKLNSKSNYR